MAKGFRLKQLKNSQFLGRQLSRVKMGQSYYAILMSTVNAISLISLAFHVDLVVLAILFPALILVALGIGYYMDKYNITVEDALKSSEMVNRFINVGDIKGQEFSMFQTEIVLEALQAMQEGKPVNVAALREKYDQYLKKWKSPDQ